MLILKQPLRCMALSPFGILSDSLEEKIIGNYRLMAADVRREELLYMITVPPELPAGGEAGISILTGNTGSRKINVEVINNLINRILLYHTESFTYQDSAYITAVLCKLGIYDVQNFMSQVKELKEETENTCTLTALYRTCGSRLEKLSACTSEHDREEILKKEQEQASVFYLHEAVYKRLETAAVYEAVANYAENQASEHEITHDEMRTAEQLKIAREITFNQLKYQISGKKGLLFYYHCNQFETAELKRTEITVNSLLSRLNAALLLNIADHLYTLRGRKWRKGPKKSYRVINALYLAGENTVNRFEAYHRQHITFHRTQDNYTGDINEAYRSEIQIIKNFLDSTDIRSSTEHSRKNFYKDSYFRKSGNCILESGHMESQRNSYPVFAEYDMERLTEWTEEERESYYQLIKQKLDQVNAQNILMHDRVSELAKKESVYSKVSIDREKAKRDTLRALEHPQEVLLEYMNNMSGPEKIESWTEERLTGLLSKETKEIYDKILSYRERTEAETESLRKEKQDIRLQETELSYRTAEVSNSSESSAEDQKDMELSAAAVSEFTDQLSRIWERSEQYWENIQQVHRIKGIPPELLYMEQESFTLLKQKFEHMEDERAKKLSIAVVSKFTNELDLIREYLQGEEEHTSEMDHASEEAGGDREKRIIREMQSRVFFNKSIEEEEQYIVKEILILLKQAFEYMEDKRMHEISADVICVFTDRLKQFREQMQAGKTAFYEQSEQKSLNHTSLIHKQAEILLEGEQYQERMTSHLNSGLIKQPAKSAGGDIHLVNTQLQEISKQTVVQNTENITEMITQGVRRQMGVIAEQVYARMEKKLANERKRRGF